MLLHTTPTLGISVLSSKFVQSDHRLAYNLFAMPCQTNLDINVGLKQATNLRGVVERTLELSAHTNRLAESRSRSTSVYETLPTFNIQ